MIAHPIIERELRIQARAKLTHWHRLLVASLAAMACVGTLTSSGSLPPRLAGQQLFSTLTALAFVFCLIEGIRKTFDCISQERREGTLDLLFLTGLRPFEIVLSKFAGAFITAFASLLAAAPAIGISLVFGGVTPGEFWRTQLVLINTLFAAAACGIVGSARHHEQTPSLLLGLGLFLALNLLHPLARLILSLPALPTFSPSIAIIQAGDGAFKANPSNFWLTLVLMQVTAWGMLVAASALLTRQFGGNEKVGAKKRNVEERVLGDYWELTLPAEPKNQTNVESPALWLADRQGRDVSLVWIAVLVLTLPYVTPLLLRRFATLTPSVLVLPSILYWIQGILPPVMLAVVTVNVFANARRSGALEIMLTTLMSPRELVQAHSTMLWRQVRLPLFLLGSLALLVQWISVGPQMSGMQSYYLTQIFTIVPGLVMVVTVCWVGMYWGVRARTPSIALGKTLLWCVVVPLFGAWAITLLIRLFLPSTASVAGGFPRWIWIPWHAVSTSRLLYSIWLIVWARRKLIMDFRNLASSP